MDSGASYENRVFSVEPGGTGAVAAGNGGAGGSHKDQGCPETSWWKLLSRSFGDAVGVSGIKFVFNGKEMMLRRIVWCLILVAATSIMLYQIIHQCIFFSTLPINTRVDIEFAENLDFPSVAICNYNLYRKSYLEKNEKEFADFLKYVAGLYAAHQPYDYMAYEGNLTTKNYSHLSLNAAHQLDSILLATFNNEAITRENFSISLLEFGACFTFNLGTVNRLEVHTPGISHGLQLVLDTRQWDYFYATSLVGSAGSAGFQIQAFDSNTSSAQVNEYGIAVGPGTRTLIGLTLFETRNLAPPHGDCGEKTLKYHDVYRVSSCRLECKTDYVIGMCGCRAPYMPGPGRECSPIEIICVRDAMEAYGRNSSHTCPCPVPCHTVRYAATVSQAKYPSDFYSQLLAAQLSANPNLNLDADYLSNNLCLINIFFNELIRETTKQQEGYPFVSLLSDIGGSLGMWMGASILTVVEIFDIMGYSLFQTRTQRSNHRV